MVRFGAREIAKEEVYVAKRPTKIMMLMFMI